MLRSTYIISSLITTYNGLILGKSFFLPSYKFKTHPHQRLVRFLAKDGLTYYGDAILPKGTTDISKATQANIIRGQIFGKHEVTDQVAEIRHLLAPLAIEDVKTVRCLGLNYEKHARESGLPIPKFPILFVSIPLHIFKKYVLKTTVQTHHLPVRPHGPNSHPPTSPKI